MSVADFMTKDLITVTPDLGVNAAIDLMREHKIHRLPVVDNGRLVGLVTQGIIEAAMPSKATSLSVYEVNYLLNKTTVRDIMEKSVLTISQNELLEDAIYKMRHYNIGVLPVLDQNGTLKGIITNNDIFDAFLNLSGYTMGGALVVVSAEDKDKVGTLAGIATALAKSNYNILTLVVNRQPNNQVIEAHIEGSDVAGIKKVLTDAGYDVLQAELSKEF
ncbi:CBS domain protein [Agrilactobacillus composti DSM 18527 = JCM 14202]|uniref:CBS domain protein n=1 Tax=Agrilactobacillus composti DSM 18527 = JCM 14202 TaxID=1423734 RepID=X0PNR6_9LACO|nr:CBS and ACT domain-containing protein [Agrilactobacillus composti]KRM32861.1 CBS domain protein [Agrilactobacillus composti DSM 18527 = JCM 14202]GAF39237.1 acetoin utilization protein, truncated [Agrilactobacillus composti DSM 18527 = JCM 14202]